MLDREQRLQKVSELKSRMQVQHSMFVRDKCQSDGSVRGDFFSVQFHARRLSSTVQVNSVIKDLWLLLKIKKKLLTQPFTLNHFLLVSGYKQGVYY